MTAPELRRLAQASVRDTAAVAAEVFLPLLAQGAIIRRPKITALAERFDTDRRGVALLRRLSARFGSGPHSPTSSPTPSNRTMHQPDQPAIAAVREEIDLLMTGRSDPRLCWPEFSDAWWRVTCRIVLGDSARNDRETIDLLTTLRRDANWAFLRLRRKLGPAGSTDGPMGTGR